MPELLPGGTVSMTAPSTVGNLDLGAVYRFVESYRKVEPDVVAFAPEKGVMLDVDVTSASPCRRALLALALQAHLRAIFNAGGKLEVDRLAIAKGDTLLLAGRQRRRKEPSGDTGHWRPWAEAAARHRSATGRAQHCRTVGCPNLRSSPTPAEKAFEDVAKVDSVGSKAVEVLGTLSRAGRQRRHETPPPNGWAGLPSASISPRSNWARLSLSDSRS